MTNPASLRELADRLDAWGRECEDLDDPHSNIPGVFLSDLISGDFYDAMKEAATQLRTAASEGGETLSESDKDVAVAQAVELAEYVERQAKGAMVEAARRFLSLPYAEQIKARLNPPEVARDAGRWRMFRRYFDTPMKREQLRMFLGMEPGVFDPSIESMIDAAISGAAGVG